MKILDTETIPLNRTCLIEASAGTGKTYTIAGLYVRLVCEGYAVDQILVVTFTEAAAAELKIRIRQRLVQTANQSSTGEEPETDMPPRIRQRLNRAILDFDLAAVMTIHAFCLLALKENAFESRIPFNIELAASSHRFVRQVSLDFFATRVNHHDPVFLKFLKQNGFTPAAFEQPSFQRVLSAVDVPVRPAAADFRDAAPAYRDACREIREMLTRDLEGIYTHVIGHPNLDKRSYRKDHVRKWLTAARAAFDDTDDVPLFQMAEGKDPLFRFTRASLESRLKNGQQLTPHDFFGLCDRLQKCCRLFEENMAALTHAFIAFYRSSHQQQKNEQGIFYFDDLIQTLNMMLRSASAAPLISRIRSRYQACLIDEFQDTDLSQYGIFSTLFLQTGRPFFMIGDPKQAIYAFRGGDIFAYLKAVMDSEESCTLQLNWRSDPGLVAAVNQVFSSTGCPFGFDDIPFLPVATPEASAARLMAGREPVTPLQFVFIPRNADIVDSRNRITKGAANSLIPDLVAADIADLLNSDVRLSDKTGKKRPVAPSDLAVLVRKNTQAPMIQQALAALNIPAVVSKTGSVFDSVQARDLCDILKAVMEPWDTGRRHAALCTGIFGMTGDDLARLDDSPAGHHAWQVFFKDLNILWRDKGIIHLMHHLLSDSRALLNPRSDTDLRALTNYHHLAEILHQKSMAGHVNPGALLDWLSEQMADPYKEIAADELRLESDNSAVAIVTVHKSKGLEYPVVFLPYLWEGESVSQNYPPVFFHDPDNHHQLTLDIGSGRMDQALEQARAEAMAEEMRVLYVAMTRASSMCRIYWGGISTAETSALARLLHDGTWDSDERLRADLEILAQKAPGHIQVSVPAYRPDPAGYQKERTVSADLFCRTLSREIDSLWRISSFSGLIQGVREIDDDRETDVSGMDEPGDPADARPVVLKDFPKGAGAGDFFHSIFETLDFQETGSGIRRLVDDRLTEFGFQPSAWSSTVTRAVSRILDTPIPDPGGPFRLKDIEKNTRLNELEFHFRVNRFSMDNLVQLFENKSTTPALRQYAAHLRQMPPQVLSGVLNGFIKGFVDLVFRFRGKWYIADYKSNYLGDTWGHYHPAGMARAMTGHHYFLQYHIYTLALDRYLAFRQESYDYSAHFGGVCYLFIRGMSPDSRAGTGIFMDRPTPELMRALPKIFGL